MNILIRNAVPGDAVEAAPLIVDAIGNIAEQMTGEESPDAIERELIGLFHRTDNRHSYRTTLVAEYEGSLAGVMVLYSGEQAIELDLNLASWLQAKNGDHIDIPPEAHRDEYYIDTVSVDPDFRGQGIGTLLLKRAEEEALQAGFAKLALNVEEEKDAAIRLYERLGYKVEEPWTIYGGRFHHMVKNLEA